MARAKVKVDHRGIAAVLKSREITAATQDAAEAVAENVRAMGIRVEGVPGNIELPVTVRMVETDRAHGLVTIAHPSGLAVQAKRGALTKAAAQAGLDVHGG